MVKHGFGYMNPADTPLSLALPSDYRPEKVHKSINYHLVIKKTLRIIIILR